MYWGFTSIFSDATFQNWKAEQVQTNAWWSRSNEDFCRMSKLSEFEKVPVLFDRRQWTAEDTPNGQWSLLQWSCQFKRLSRQGLRSKFYFFCKNLKLEVDFTSCFFKVTKNLKFWTYLKGESKAKFEAEQSLQWAPRSNLRHYSQLPHRKINKFLEYCFRWQGAATTGHFSILEKT